MQSNQATQLEEILTAVFFCYFPQYMRNIQIFSNAQGCQAFTQWTLNTSEAQRDKIHSKVS